MLLKLIWVSIMFLTIVGIIFFASFGIDIPISYYEKTETLIGEED